MEIQYKVKIKVREEGQAKGTAYPDKVCSTLKECLEEIESFFKYNLDGGVQEYPDIRIKAEEVNLDDFLMTPDEFHRMMRELRGLYKEGKE